MPPIPLRTFPKQEEESPRRWRRWRWLLLLLIPLILWQSWRMVSSSRHLAKVKTLQASLGDTNLSPDQRQKLFQDLRGEMAQLTPDQRSQLNRDRQKQQEKEYDRYFAMSKAEQKRYLDERINRMQQAMNQARPNGQGNAGVPGAKANISFGTGGGTAGGPNGPGGKSKNPDDIESRKKKMLDSTTTEFRAKNDRFRKEMEQRMKERGITPPAGGRR